MSRSEPPARPSGQQPQGRWAIPSWLASLMLHLVVLTVLAITFRPEGPKGVASERVAQVGIVLEHQGESGPYFTGEESGPARDASSQAAPPEPFADPVLEERPPSDPTNVLPKAQEAIGIGPAAPAWGGTAPGEGLGPATNSGPSGDGPVTTGVFGAQGTGQRFVYVFDRSGSMGGAGRNALAASKQELWRSIQNLGVKQQFQIIFYNERPAVFSIRGVSDRLFYATSENKEFARRFILSITPDGGTRHEEALRLAIAMKPDVIFFLTDADEPRLSSWQLEDLHRLARGISINAIEFGLGQASGDPTFLARIAAQNRGQYAYVDIAQLFPVVKP